MEYSVRMSDKIAPHQLTAKDFRYMDETNIHNELKCSICLQCFIEPVSSSESCNHTFCNECIQESLKTDDKCPICRRSISADDFKLVESRVVINMLDQFLVQCNYCDRINISRGDVVIHLQQCDNFIIPCSEADLGCSWTGQRKDMTDHLKTCVHHQIHPLIQQLYAELERLQVQVKDLQAQHQRLETQIRTQAKDGSRFHGTLKSKNQVIQARRQVNRDEPTTITCHYNFPHPVLPPIRASYDSPSPIPLPLSPLPSVFRGPLSLSYVPFPPTPYPLSPQLTTPPPVLPRRPLRRSRMPLTNREKRGINANRK